MLALGLLGQLVILGDNTRVLAALGAMVSIGLGLITILLLGRSVPRAFWKMLMWPAILFALALAITAYTTLPTAQVSPPWLADITQAARASGGSLTPDATALEISKWLGLAATFVAAAAIGSQPRGFARCLEALIVIAVAQAFLGLVLYGMDPFTVAGLDKGAHRWRFTGTFLNANAAGCVFAMFATIAMAMAMAKYPPRRNAEGGFLAKQSGKIWSSLAALLLAGACALTGSRLALVLLIFAAIILLIRGGAVPQALKSGKPLTLLMVLLPILAIVFGVLFAGPRALSRIADLGVSAAARFDTQRLVVDLIRQAPIWGYGLGAFGDVYQARLGADHAADMWNLGAAHNAALQMILEGGLLFAGAMTVCLGLVWVRVVKNWRAAPANSDIRLGVVLAVLIVGVTSFFDIVLSVPAAASLLAALSGLLWGAVAEQPNQEGVRA
ncbi:O-antigen ligase family protein [Caulobacter sp. LARHSG274]